MNQEALKLYLIEKLSFTKSQDYTIGYNGIIIQANANTLCDILSFLKNDTNFQCKILIDLFGCDYPNRRERFEVVYNLLSIVHNIRVVIKVHTKNDGIPSVHYLFDTAVWFEREAWDMYGIKFTNNPDLRRILTDYGFEGHPLRKDFPLSGYVEVHYDSKQEKVVYIPVELEQAYRNFDFVSPWEGSDYVLPGDEKANK